MPQDLTRFEIKTGEISAAITAVRTEHRAVVQNYPAMVIFHRFREPNLLRSDLTIGVLGEPNQATARAICRSSEDMFIVIDRCGYVEPHSVGGLVVPPKQLAICRGNSSDGHGEELHVLVLPTKVDRDG